MWSPLVLLAWSSYDNYFTITEKINNIRNEMSNIELSVIIVNYKSWELLGNCIESFNSFPPALMHEIIVVDNDSQDGVFDEFSKRHPDIKFIKNKGNYGFANGCNVGASYAEGDYLLFLNPDTELIEDNAIDEMVGFLKNNANTGLVSCRTKTAKKIERELLFTNPWLLIGF
jgi:GT2 family glycosyltransferase